MKLPGPVFCYVIALGMVEAVIGFPAAMSPNAKLLHMPPEAEAALLPGVIRGFERNLDQWISKHASDLTDDENLVLHFIGRCYPLVNWQNYIKIANWMLRHKEHPSLNDYKRAGTVIGRDYSPKALYGRFYWDIGIPKPRQPKMNKILDSTSRRAQVYCNIHGCCRFPSAQSCDNR